MPIKTAKEIRAEAWKALGENGQYWTFFGGGIVLAFLMVLFILPIMVILLTGIGFSGMYGQGTWVTH